MKKFFKQLFCSHKYKKVKEYYSGSLTGLSKYECKKCGKIKYDFII